MDHNRAAMLLAVMDKAKQWPNLKGVHDAAMYELEELNKEALEEAAERAKAAEEAKVEAAAREAARVEREAKKVPEQNGNGRRVA